MDGWNGVMGLESSLSGTNPVIMGCRQPENKATRRKKAAGKKSKKESPAKRCQQVSGCAET